MRRQSFRILLITGFCISAAFLLLYLKDQPFSWSLISPLKKHLGLIAGILALQMLAHAVRAARWRLTLQPIREGSFQDFFKALSIGFAMNAVLPFRLGELVRAFTLGRLLSISRTSVFCTILFERAIDGILLGGTFLLASVIMKTTLSPVFFGLAVAVTGVGVLCLAILRLIQQENPTLLKTIHKISHCFNPKIRRQVHRISWSAIHGTNVFLKNIQWGRFLLLTVAMWAGYLGSLALLYEIASPGIVSPVFASLASLLCVSVPSGPGYLGTYHYFLSLGLGTEGTLLYALASWSVMVVPIAVVGAYWVLRHQGGHWGAHTWLTPVAVPRSSRLFRNEALSEDFYFFLESYFSQRQLSRFLGKLEFSGSVRIERILKGGSNALSFLIWDQNQLLVRKMALEPYAEKLESQYEWLKSREGLDFLPKVLELKKEKNLVFFDAPYYSGFDSFYHFIHTQETAKSAQILDRLLERVETSIHKPGELIHSPARLKKYLDSKLVGKVQDAVHYDEKVLALTSEAEIVVNGVAYPNFNQVLNKITSHPKISRDLSHFYDSPIHGDLTVDNVIVQNDKFMLLDPNNENLISDPIVDYAKLYQSLHTGYEHLIQLTEVQIRNNEIWFDDQLSNRYAQLFQYLSGRLERKLSEERFKLIPFHEAIHYARLLTYRARHEPATLGAFYGTLVRLLNDFYLQYTKDEALLAAAA